MSGLPMISEIRLLRNPTSISSKVGLKILMMSINPMMSAMDSHVASTVDVTGRLKIVKRTLGVVEGNFSTPFFLFLNKEYQSKPASEDESGQAAQPGSQADFETEEQHN